MDVDVGDDAGNVSPEEASPLAEDAEFVDCDGLDVGDEVGDDSLRDFFVEFYRGCFVTLCEVLRECLGQHNYPFDLLVAADLEARESEAMDVVESVDAADVEGFADRTRALTFSKMLVSDFVNTVSAKCLLEFVNSSPEMVLSEILGAEFYEAKDRAIFDAVAVLVDGLESGEIAGMNSTKVDFAEVIRGFMVMYAVHGPGEYYLSLVAASDASAAASDDKENLSADVLEARALGEAMRDDSLYRVRLGLLEFN